MLGLLIVDDEEDVLEGLSEMIDWAGLGFFVAGKLRDGRDAIDFIGRQNVDVILSDIKMTYASGLDIASYVQAYKPQIKVVLLSGYQEFALAKEAIKYNVSHYLLKPADLDEIAFTFAELGKQIRKEKQERELLMYRVQHYKALVPLLQEQFFINLLSGGPLNKEEIQRKMLLIGMPADPGRGQCSVLHVRWTPPHTRRLTDEHAREYFKAINSAFVRENEEIQYTVIHHEGQRFMVIAIAITEMPRELYEKRMEQFFLHHQKSLQAVLGLAVALEEIRHYTTMLHMLAEQSKHRESPLSKLYKPAEAEDLTALKSSIVNVLLLLGDHLENDLLESAVCELKGLEDMSGIRSWCHTYFDSMLHILDGQPERVIITKAKQFIARRYNEEFSLEDVADAVGLNPAYFSRLFKQETGETFSDYRITIRMEKAIEYLKNPDYKIYEICDKIGYKNLKYFYKLFKKYTGLTPSEFREIERGSGEA